MKTTACLSPQKITCYERAVCLAFFSKASHLTLKGWLVGLKFNPRFCESELEKNSECFVCFLRIVWLLCSSFGAQAEGQHAMLFLLLLLLYI
jgi:hypothetical protein